MISRATRRGNPLRDGDIVDTRRAATQQFYFTGGLLPGGRFPLPADTRLNAIQAIAAAGGNLDTRPELLQRELVIIRRQGNVERVCRYNVNWLLRNPGAVVIRNGDRLQLNYK